jgi:hypothetical protein
VVKARVLTKKPINSRLKAPMASLLGKELICIFSSLD